MVAKLVRQKSLALNSILHDPVLNKYFLDFCERQWCLENALFLIEVEMYKGIKNMDERIQVANIIFSTFIEEESPFDISVDSPLRVFVEGQLSSGRPDIFDQVLKEAAETLQSCVLMKWEKTEHFRVAMKEQKKAKGVLTLVPFRTSTEGKTLLQRKRLRATTVFDGPN